MHGFTQNTQITQNPLLLIRIQRMFLPTFFYCVMSVRTDMLAIISGAEVLPTCSSNLLLARGSQSKDT